jgi:hypothetical protein
LSKDSDIVLNRLTLVAQKSEAGKKSASRVLDLVGYIDK